MVGSIDVLVLGGAGVDTVVYVSQLPLPLADSYLVPAIEARAGQTGDGVALGLHTLGLRTMHVDVIGDDREGELVRELHDTWDVPFTGVLTAAGTKRAVNLVDPDGRRLSLYDGSRAGEADRFPPDLVTSLAAASRHAHVSITQPCGHAMPALVEAGVTISTDLHNWDGDNPYQEAFAYQADIVFLSTTALPDRETAMRAIVHNGRARIVVGTAGAEGGYLLSRDADEVRHFPAVAPPAPVKDSNGAGDAFVSGFLFGYLSGAPLDSCVRYGAVAGAHVCTVPASAVDPIDRDTLLARAASA